MKNLLRYWFVLVLCASFAACSSDDDEQPVTWSSIAGSYTGTLTMRMQYAELAYDNQTIVLSVASDNTANLTYSGSFGSMNLNSIVVTKNSNGSFSINGSGIFSMGMTAESVADYACTVSGTISSDKSDYSIVFSLPSVMGGTTVTFTPTAQ